MANTAVKTNMTPAVVKTYIGTGTPAEIAYVIENVKAELALPTHPGILTAKAEAKRKANLNALLAALLKY